MANELQTKLDAILEDKNTNLLPENLKAGVTCLGVEGNMESGVDTSDATATSADLINPKTAYVNGEKVVGNINKSTADAIIGTSDDTVEEFRTNILNALSGHMNADESGINYDLYPQKYGTGDTSLDKPVNIYFVYENPEESCYDMIAIRTGNWNIKRNSNAGWNVSVSRTEHYVTTTNGTDWRNGVDFYHYRINYNFEFVSRVTKSKEKTAVWGNQSMNTLFSINSCLYENLLLVSPNYLSRMIANVSSFAVYEDRAGKSSYPSLNEELNLILNEKNTKIIPENIKKDVTILNVTGTLEQGIDTSDATATANDIVQGATAYANGEKIEGNLIFASTLDNRNEDETVKNQPFVQVYNFNGETYFDMNVEASRMRGDMEYVDRAALDLNDSGGHNLVIAIGDKASNVANAIGLTSDKIVSGNTILGVEGTAEAGGSQYEEIKLSELQVGDSIIGIRVKGKPTEVTDENSPVFEEVQGEMNGLIWMGVYSDGENSNRLVFSCAGALGGMYYGCHSELFKRVDSSWTSLSTSELHILTSPMPIGYINPTDIPKLDNCISVIKVK